MQKTGFRWEDVTVDNITVDDLDDESFKIFRREALSKKRMTETELNVTNEEILRKLHLMVDRKLKRSAVLLFYRDPEILPEGWTVDTLMEPHDSKPYNPDIARVFYRAGFIENLGQGIQKICDECKGIGTELPVYELTGTTLRIRFKALESVLIDRPKAPKHQNTDKLGALDDAMVLRIIEILEEQPDISQEVLGESLGVTRRVVQKYINVLKEAGRIERIGGKRYGHWEIVD